MVKTGTKRCHHLRRAVGNAKALPDHFLELGLFHDTGTGAGQQHSSRRYCSYSLRIQGFIASKRTLLHVKAFGEGRWIKDDNVKCPALLHGFLKIAIHVAHDKFVLAGE